MGCARRTRYAATPRFGSKLCVALVAHDLDRADEPDRRARRRSADDRRSCASRPACAERRGARARRCRAPRRSSASRARPPPAPGATSTCSRGRRCRACRFARAGCRRARSRRQSPRSACRPADSAFATVIDVRLQVERLRAEHVAGAAEAADHFVDDEQDVVLAQDRLHALEIRRRRDHTPPAPMHRLGEERRDGVGTFAQDQSPRARRRAASRTASSIRRLARRDSNTAQLGVQDAGHRQVEVGDARTRAR